MALLCGSDKIEYKAILPLINIIYFKVRGSANLTRKSFSRSLPSTCSLLLQPPGLPPSKPPSWVLPDPQEVDDPHLLPPPQVQGYNPSTKPSYKAIMIGTMPIWKTIYVMRICLLINFSLDGKTPGRSHLRRGDHIYPRAITSCPGHALCLTWQVKCIRPGDHIRACCNVLHGIATPGTRHECDRRGVYI